MDARTVRETAWEIAALAVSPMIWATDLIALFSARKLTPSSVIATFWPITTGTGLSWYLFELTTFQFTS